MSDNTINTIQLPYNEKFFGAVPKGKYRGIQLMFNNDTIQSLGQATLWIEKENGEIEEFVVLGWRTKKKHE